MEKTWIICLDVLRSTQAVSKGYESMVLTHTDPKIVMNPFFYYRSHTPLDL
jgi:hypothetical protein